MNYCKRNLNLWLCLVTVSPLFILKLDFFFVIATFDSNMCINFSHVLFDVNFDSTCEITLLLKQLLMIVNVRLSCSTQSLVFLAPMDNKVGVLIVISITIGFTNLTFVFSTINHIFSYSNNGVIICFHTWKYCPSNLVIGLTSTLVLNHLKLKFNWFSCDLNHCWFVFWLGHGKFYILQCNTMMSSMSSIIETNGGISKYIIVIKFHIFHFRYHNIKFLQFFINISIYYFFIDIMKVRYFVLFIDSHPPSLINFLTLKN